MSIKHSTPIDFFTRQPCTLSVMESSGFYSSAHHCAQCRRNELMEMSRDAGTWIAARRIELPPSFASEALLATLRYLFSCFRTSA